MDQIKISSNYSNFARELKYLPLDTTNRMVVKTVERKVTYCFGDDKTDNFLYMLNPTLLDMRYYLV